MSNDGYVDVHLEYSSEVFEIEPFADGSLSHEELFELTKRPVLALIFSSETRRRLIVPKQGVFSKPPNGWLGGTITAVVTMPVVFEPPSRPESQVADQKPFLDTVLGKRAYPTPEDRGPIPAKVTTTQDHCGSVAAIPCPASSSTTNSQPSLPVEPSKSRQFSFSAPVVRSFVPSEVNNTGNDGGRPEDVHVQSVSTIPSTLDPDTGAEQAVSTVANVAPFAISAISDNSINPNATAVDKEPSSVITKAAKTSSSSSSAEAAKHVSTTSLAPVPASITESSEKTSSAPATTNVGTPASKLITDDDDDVVILKVVIKKKASSAKAASSSVITSSAPPVKVEPIISGPPLPPVDPWLSAYSVPTFDALYKLPEFEYSKTKCGLAKTKSFNDVRVYVINSFVNCVPEFKARNWSIHTFCIFRRYGFLTCKRIKSIFIAPHRPLEPNEALYLSWFTQGKQLVLMTPALVERMEILLNHVLKHAK
uniref:JmjC domain-containing protein n=1 Tax=Panagrellus redivivus TaxID=6233 RepID=A0A7E4V557_PANRE